MELYLSNKFADLIDVEEIYEHLDEYIYKGLVDTRNDQKILYAISNKGTNNMIYDHMKAKMLEKFNNINSLSKENDEIIDLCIVNTYIGVLKKVVEDVDQSMDLKKVSHTVADFIQNGINV